MGGIEESPHFGMERYSEGGPMPSRMQMKVQPSVGVIKLNETDTLYVTNPRRQVGGNHYLKHGNMQPFDIIDEYNLNFYEGCALKYLLRWRDKDNILDLEKAKHYIEILIQKERSPDGGELPAESNGFELSEVSPYPRNDESDSEAPTS